MLSRNEGDSHTPKIEFGYDNNSSLIFRQVDDVVKIIDSRNYDLKFTGKNIDYRYFGDIFVVLDMIRDPLSLRKYIVASCFNF